MPCKFTIERYLEEKILDDARPIIARRFEDAVR